jgi:hypothetical protein
MTSAAGRRLGAAACCGGEPGVRAPPQRGAQGQGVVGGRGVTGMDGHRPEP